MAAAGLGRWLHGVRRALLALAALLALGALPARAAPPGAAPAGAAPAEGAQRWLPALAQVVSTTAKGTHAVGSGFFADGSRFFTAYHVVQGGARLRVLLGDGAVRSATVVAYDAARDLAELALDAPYRPPVSLPLARATPPRLTAAQGWVLGHPDQKRDFAIRVSFPKDTLLPATQWLASADHGGFVFQTPALELLVLDGTLNRGMSGGPVLVEGEVVGIFSGGEERSGAGLAWAIPVRYLASMTRNEARLAPDRLPPLAMLKDGSGTLLPLKRAATRMGGQLVEASLRLSEATGELDQALRHLAAPAALLAATCRDDPDPQALADAGLRPEAQVATQRRPWRTCASVFVLSMDTDSADSYGSNIDRLEGLQTRIAAALDGLSTAVEAAIEQVPMRMTAAALRSGSFRNLAKQMEQCASLQSSRYRDSSAPLSASLKQLGPRLKALAQRLRSDALKAHAAGTPAWLDALGNDAVFREVATLMAASGADAERYRTQGVHLIRDHYAACSQSFASALEGLDDPAASAGQHLTVRDMQGLEARYLGSVVQGAYLAVDQQLRRCRSAPGMADYHSQWRADWHPALRRSLELMRRSGLSDEDIEQARREVESVMTQALDGLALPAGMSPCAREGGVPVLDTFATDPRLRELVEFLEVPMPPAARPLPWTQSTHTQLRTVLAEFVARRFAQGQPVSLPAGLGTDLALLASAAAVTRQAEQCSDWYPQRHGDLARQLARWSDAHGARLQAAQARARGALARMADGDAQRSDPALDDMIDRLADGFLLALRRDFQLDDARTHLLCQRFSQRLGDLTLKIE